MKRLLIGFLIVMLALGFLVSCNSSDDDDDVSITQPPTENWLYGVNIGYYGARDGWIYVFAYTESNIIETCTLLINNEEVMLTYNSEWNEWWGSHSLEEGVTYTFDLTINNGAYHQNADLAVPYVPVLDFDSTWDGQNSYELTWELEEDSDAQSLYIWGPDDNEYRSLGSIYILASLRAYMLAAALHGYTGSEGQNLDVSVDQENFVLVNQILLITYAYAYAYFGVYNEPVLENPQDHSRRITQDVIRRIQ